MSRRLGIMVFRDILAAGPANERRRYAIDTRGGVGFAMKAVDHSDSDPTPVDAEKATVRAVNPMATSLELTTFEPVLQSYQPNPSVAVAVAPELGERFVHLVLHDQGGMGRIWVARDTSLARDIALKELHPELGNDPIALARFLREAQITGQLEHPGIVPVYELIRHGVDKRPFYVMRFVRGRTLTRAMMEYHLKRIAGQEVSLELAALLQAFVMVCNTIGYAHSRGVIHRDLKGQNVILGDFGEVVVLDWGLAKRVGTPESPEETIFDAGAIDSDDATKTQHGQALGTPASMAPEQAAGRLEEIDHRTDIYGLGAILYEILTGQPPFTGTSTREVLRKVVEQEPIAPRHLCPEAPLGLETVCLRALAKKPSDRYAAAKEMGEAVQQWQGAERRQAEEALRASEEQYHSLADLIPGIVWTARADGWIEYANQFWFKFTGLTLEATQGDGWAVVVHPDDLERVSQLWTKSLQGGTPIEVEYRIRRTDGVYRWFLAQAKPLRDREGRISKWFGMLTEIDDQKQNAKALERQNALVRLLHQVTVAAYDAATVEEALQAGIDQVCAYTGWPVGHVYVRAGHGSQELLPTTIWHVDHPGDFEDFMRVTAATRLAPGVGLPGRVMAGKLPLWIMDVSRDDNFPRAKAATNLGVKGAFGFPVLTALGVVAVLEFFTSEPKEPDEVLLAAMTQIGIQLGQVFERKQAEAELQEAKPPFTA